MRFQWVDGLLLIAGLVLLGYTSVRAYRLSFTHDECFTYLYYVRTPIQNTLTFTGPAPSNTHLINSLSMRLLDSLVGDREVILRLPNLLAHLLYLICSFRIARRLANPVLMVCGFLLLNSNPFMLDFFSLARGYGLALAFMLLSLDYLLSSFAGRGAFAGWNNFLCTLFAALAVLSHLAFLNYYVALSAVLLIGPAGQALASARRLPPWRRVLSATVRQSGPVLVNSLLLAAVIARPIGKLRREQEFYFGGDTGFWRDTVTSLIQGSLYEQAYPWDSLVLIKLAVLLTLAVSAVVYLYALARPARAPRALAPAILFSITVLSGFSTVAQHALFGTKFLIERTALLFIPLFSLTLVLLFDFLSQAEHSFIKRLSLPVLVLWTLGLSWHATRAANLTHCLDWKHQANIKAMLADLEAIARPAAKTGPEVRLGINPIFEMPIHFYKATRRRPWLEALPVFDLKNDCDYYFYAPVDREAVQDKGLIPLKEYPVTHDILAKRPSI